MLSYINGDLEAFETLYLRHSGKVMGYLNSRLASRDEAEDVFQEAFVKLHRYRFKYEDDVPFLPWLFIMVKNTLIDHVRKRDTRHRHIQSNADHIDNVVDESLEGLPVIASISQLSSLDTRQRQILELRFNEDLSFEEIATRMETSPTNVRKIVSRAIQKLRGLMSGKET